MSTAETKKDAPAVTDSVWFNECKGERSSKDAR
jgi:hypothetical protein